MSEDSFKSIRNGAIASVIAGVVLLAIPVLREYVFNFFAWIWVGIVWCWDAFFVSYALPGWVWLVVIVLAIIGLVNIYLAIRGESKQPEFKSYVEDYIQGAKWRWDWVGNQISNVWCFCPRCDATLVYDDSSRRNYLSDVRKTDFICENCGHTVVTSIAGGDKDYAISAIRREIDRRIRTNEYKKH